MKRILAALLAVMLLCCAAAYAEDEGDFFGEEDFGFDFDDDGYSGEWVKVDALDIEFCLPEGWSQVTPADGAAYTVASGDGSATLSISLAAEGVEDVAAWGEVNLSGYESDEAGFYDALVVEEERSIAIYADASEQGLLAFSFTRADSDALSRDFALQIVGSACAIWDVGDEFFDDGDDFDFGDAFGEELG